jgi:hypothetical protein
MGAILALLTGGATGLLGVVFQRFFDFLKVKQELQVMKLKFENDREMRKIDAEMLDKEWAHRTKKAEIETAGAIEVEDSKGFATSLIDVNKMLSERIKPTKAQGWVLLVLDAIKTLVRPSLTVYLCWITTMIYLEAQMLLTAYQYTMGSDHALAMVDKIVATILYLTTTCVLWWFGTRNKQKAPGVN